MARKTVLNNLQPINLGTWKAESLTSYLTRLAYSHNISVYKLFDDVIYPYIKDKTRIYPAGAHSVNGVSQYALGTSKVVSQLTGIKDIQCMTLLPISEGVCFTAQRFLRNKRAWCPDCYKEQKERYNMVYEPLLWALQLTDFCPKHQKPLTTQCPYCKKKQPYILGHPQLEYCFSCAGPLYKPETYQRKTIPPKNLMESEWDTFNVGDLIERCSTTPYKPIPIDINSMYKRYLNHVFNGDVIRMSQQLGHFYKLIEDWYTDKRKPRLKTILSVCRKLNKPLLEFIQNDGALTYPDTWNTDLLPSPSKKRRSPEFNKATEKHLKSLLADPPHPFPSLPLICKSLGCTPGYINYRFPNYRKKICARYLASVKRISNTRISNLKKRLESEIKRLDSEDTYPSYNALSKVLPRGWYKHKELANHRRNLIIANYKE